MNDSVNAVTQVLVSVDGKSAYENTASFIVLAHELIHTYHVMNKTINEERLGERLYRNDSGMLCVEKSGGKIIYTDEEFETVGLGYRTLWKGRDPLAINPFWCRSTFNLITENALRDEHNMNRRIAYTTK